MEVNMAKITRLDYCQYLLSTQINCEVLQYQDNRDMLNGHS